MITVTVELEDGTEDEFDLPSKMVVCPECNGETYVLCEGMRGHAYTSEEFYEEFDDEGREEYFRRGGIYDVICPTCKGKNVVASIDEDACNRNERLKEILALWNEQEESRYQADADMRAEMRMERMMGC
jgi:uncharacterized protein YbaR (Trm112 family)